MAHLVILGDLFEFLFGFKNFSSQEAFCLQGVPPRLQKASTSVSRGNPHEIFRGKSRLLSEFLFSEHFGMEVEVYPVGVKKGWKGRGSIAHGDLSNPKQWTYRTLRRILKNPSPMVSSILQVLVFLAEWPRN